MPAAVASRGWMSRPAAGLGVGDTQGTEFCWGGGQILGRSYLSPPGGTPTRAAVLLSACKGCGTN